MRIHKVIKRIFLCLCCIFHLASCKKNQQDTNESLSNTEQESQSQDVDPEGDLGNNRESGSDSGTNNESNSSANNNSNNVNESNDNLNNQEIKELKLEDIKEMYPDKEVLVWGYNDIFYITPEQNIAVNDILQKDNDFVIHFQQIPETKFESTINQMMTSVESLDIISASIGQAGKLQGTFRALFNGWFMDLDEYSNSIEYEQLRSVFPDNMWETFYVNGQLLGVNGMMPVYTENVYYVNTRIMNQYGITDEELSKRKPWELKDYLETVYEGENKENFANYIEMMRGTNEYASILDPYNNVCSAIGVHVNEDSLAVNIFESKDFVLYLKNISEYARQGYMNTEKVDDFFICRAVNDIYGLYGNNAVDNLRNQYNQVEDITIVSYGTSYLSGQMNSLTGISVNSDHKSGALKALSLIFSQSELSDIVINGVEGVDYEIEDGKLQSMGDTFSMKELYFGNSMITTPKENEPSNKKEVAFEVVNGMKVPNSVGVYMDLSAYKEEIASINAIINQYEGLYQGQYEDVDSVLEELNDKHDQTALDEIIAYINEQILAVHP